jgi:hypothetical protein
MGRVRTLFALMLALASVPVSQGATLVKTDFAKGDAKGWMVNGDAKLEKIGEAGLEQVLQLTSNEVGQAGTAWTELSTRVPSFSFIADVRVRFNPEGFGPCPADGWTLAFAPVGMDAVGTGGSGLGVFGPDSLTAFEVNTYHGQGLATDAESGGCGPTGKHETFAFDVITPGLEDKTRSSGEPGTPEKGGVKIGQVVPPTGLRIVDGGWYRYQWNASQDGTMQVYVTGLDAANQRFQKVKVLEVKMGFNPIDFEGRWGLTAGTGAAVQTVEVAAARIDAPMVEPQ